jgi:hypothetical protein
MDGRGDCRRNAGVYVPRTGGRSGCRKDQAIRYIKKGNEEGFQLIKDYLYPYPLLKSNPFFENLRSDPRFQEVVRNEERRFNEKMRKYGDL